jgi:hypothetical protein
MRHGDLPNTQFRLSPAFLDPEPSPRMWSDPTSLPDSDKAFASGSQPLAGQLRKLRADELRGHHLGAAAALEGRKYSDAAAAGIADRHDAVFDGDAAFALALFA